MKPSGTRRRAAQGMTALALAAFVWLAGGSRVSAAPASPVPPRAPGATISVGMLAGVAKSRAESFSFALAVVLTPPIVVRELMRLIHAQKIEGTAQLTAAVVPSLLGAVFAFFSGLLALKWLSQWLERGRWYLFGIYCLAAAAAVACMHNMGY